MIFYSYFFFFNDTATTEIYTLSLHDALPICHSLRHQTRPGHGAQDRGFPWRGLWPAPALAFVLRATGCRLGDRPAVPGPTAAPGRLRTPPHGRLSTARPARPR